MFRLEKIWPFRRVNYNHFHHRHFVREESLNNRVVIMNSLTCIEICFYRGADKSLARPTFRCILFDGENISFDASLVIYVYINSTNIPPIMIINRIYGHQKLLSL
jgi:hypothetical protein